MDRFSDTVNSAHDCEAQGGGEGGEQAETLKQRLL